MDNQTLFKKNVLSGSVEQASKFDYESIPKGFYDDVFNSGFSVRRSWHIEKFERVRECLPSRQDQSILDIGCFAGTFLSLLPESQFSFQVGVDILSQQIDYAKKKYSTPYRKFSYLPELSGLVSLPYTFDCITLIEVIEHLAPHEIRDLFNGVNRLLKPNGKLIVSTPNYASAWPVLEYLVNRFSEIKYQEQHLTKFSYFNVVNRLRNIRPSLLDEYTVDFVTTSHFVTPFLGLISVAFARKLSSLIPHRIWRFPFGALLLLSLTKNPPGGIEVAHASE